MLISQSKGKSDNGHGGLVMSFAELRQELAASDGISETARQRLRSLTRRLAKVQALGDEFTRVSLSEDAAEKSAEFDRRDSDTESNTIKLVAEV